MAWKIGAGLFLPGVAGVILHLLGAGSRGAGAAAPALTGSFASATAVPRLSATPLPTQAGALPCAVAALDAVYLGDGTAAGGDIDRCALASR